MAAAAKTAQEEARNKSKSVKKGSDTSTKAKLAEGSDAEQQEETKVPAPFSPPGLFDAPVAAIPAHSTSPPAMHEERELLAETRSPSRTTTMQMKPPDGVVSRVGMSRSWPGYAKNARSHLRTSFNGPQVKEYSSISGSTVHPAVTGGLSM